MSYTNPPAAALGRELLRKIPGVTVVNRADARQNSVLAPRPGPESCSPGSSGDNMKPAVNSSTSSSHGNMALPATGEQRPLRSTSSQEVVPMLIWETFRLSGEQGLECATEVRVALAFIADMLVMRLVNPTQFGHAACPTASCAPSFKASRYTECW